MKRIGGLALLVAAMALTGCASSAGSAEPAQTKTATPTPTPTATPATAMGLCEVMGERFVEYPDYVLAISNGEFDEATHEEYFEWAERLDEAAPTDARATLAKFTDPIYQVQAVVEDGGGSLNFTTDDYKAGTVEMLQYCVDAGYKIDN